jgi:hypothetical protein
MSTEPEHSDPPRAARRFISVWHDLQYVCTRIRYWWYIRTSKVVASRYENRLERLLKSLPPGNVAIVAAEGRALLYLLKGQIRKEIEFRHREIELIVRLQKSLRQSVESGRMTKRIAAEILTRTGCDHGRIGLQRRRAALASL